MSHTPHAKHQRLGGKVGPRLAVVVSKAMGDHLRRTGHYRAKLHADGLNEFFRQVGVEKRQHYSPLLELYLGAETTPEAVEKVLRFMHSGVGEASEIPSLLGIGQAVGTSIGAALANYLAPVNQNLLAKDPNTLLSPETAAQAQVRGVSKGWNFSYEHLGQGLSTGRYNMLLELAYNWPGMGEMLELLRRGLVSEDIVHTALTRNGVPPNLIGELLHLKRNHLGPADAALAVLRGWIDQPAGAQIAAVGGITSSDFDLLVKNTGEPPGLMQLLEAYRRGFIDKARLEKGIRESRVRAEWIDVVEKLRFEPASTSDAARAVVQHHLSDEQGKQIAELNGLRGEDWGWLIKTIGNPPGPMEMLTLLNRGQVSQAGVEQALRESHLKNEYIPHLIQLKVKIPPLFQLAKMVERGSLPLPRAIQLLRDEGYEQDVAEAVVHSSSAGQSVKEKQLAAGQVTELYHDHAITRESAVKHLEAIGYHKANAEWLLSITDLKRERAMQEAAISPIKSAYIAHHITEQQASADLDKLQIPAAQRDYYLALWTIDRTTRRRTLTEAQIVKANEAGMFTDEVAIARLQGLGYDNEDARIILDLEKHRTKFV